MAAPITIGIAADANDFARGIKSGVVTPLEGVADVYDDVRKASDKAAKDADLTRSLTRSQDETKTLRRDYDKLGEQIRDTGRRGRDMGDDIEAGTDKARRGVDDFRDEANSTAKESAASFDGSAESIGDSFQEIAANAFSGFGPAGAAAGIAAAIGLGAALSAINAQQEAVDALKQKFADAYQEAASQGRDYLDQAQVDAELLDLIFNPDRANEFKQIQSDAKTLGAEALDVARAYSGDQKTLNDLIGVANDKRQTALDKSYELGGAVYEQLGPLADVTLRLQDHQTILADNSTKARDLLAYQFEQAKAQVGVSTEATRTRDAFALVDAAVRGIPTQLTIPVDVDLTQANRQIELFQFAQRTIDIAVRTLTPNGKPALGG